MKMTIQSLNSYYLVEIKEEEKKSGILMLNNTKTPICKAVLLSVPPDDELSLNVGDVVFIQHFYGHHYCDDERRMFLKHDHIIGKEKINHDQIDQCEINFEHVRIAND